MTNQEAIDILMTNIALDRQGIEYCHDELGIEALEIAIKALEQEPSGDLISRQAVVEFVEYIQSIKDNHNDEGSPINYGTICDLVIRGWKLLDNIKESLTSVNPQEPCEDAISRQAVLDLCDMRDRYEIPYEYDEDGKHIKGYDEGRIINVTKLNKLSSVNPQEPKILNTLDFAIDASNGDTNYFVGFRNGLRYAKSLIDGEEPQFENCTEKVIRMRDATPEEQKLINNYIKSISRSTGVNFGTLEQEPMTTMVYPQVEGITPTVVLDCDRNICIKNEYNGIGCDECEVTKSQEPTCDLISRQEVFDLFKTFWRCFASHTDEEIFKKEIAELPPVKQEPKTGHWIITYPFGTSDPIYECPYCKASNNSVFKNFCPNCGCRMVEPQESEEV